MGSQLKFPIGQKAIHGPATSFQCEDLAELAHQLPDRLGEGYEAERFGGDSLLIWRTSPAACYLIQRQTGEKAGSRCNFLLFDMEARLGVGGDRANLCVSLSSDRLDGIAGDALFPI